ncbi:MAG: AraC family transcriptional regulator [Clostridiales bacterium]|nr:AraC family transcriptional regulator [Clostridiales bacterium]
MTYEKLDAFLREWTPNELRDREQYLQALENAKNKYPSIPTLYAAGHFPHNITLEEWSPIKIYRHERYCTHYYHTHSNLEIMYMYSGKCQQEIDENVITLNEGDLFFVSPGTFHIPDIHDDSILINIIIEIDELSAAIKQLDEIKGKLIDYLKDIVRSHHCADYLYIPASQDLELRNMLYALINEYFEHREFSEFQMRMIFNQIVCQLERSHSENMIISTLSQHKTIPIKWMLQYISYNVQDISLEKLAHTFHYSKQHICRIILKATGKTFNEYLNDIKLSRAKMLLKTTNLPVVEIASFCGYTSNAYFHRLFRRVEGMTPIEYRKSNIK